MTNLPADELITALAELRALFPDWRLGQLVCNLASAAGGMDVDAVWNMEDQRLLDAARRLIDQNSERQALPKQGLPLTGGLASGITNPPSAAGS